MAGSLKLVPSDVTYASMPLFHSAALFTAWGPTIAAGATLALRRRFSASAFLPDVRKFGATYFNYVGKPLAYILDTPELPDDGDNPLQRGFGNEGNEADVRRFEARFNCPLTDGYGQTETGASIGRVPGTPVGSLGKGTDDVKVINPETGEECPPARFDDDGKLLNAEEATGEIVELRRRRASRATGRTKRRCASATATAPTGPATSPTATRTASSTSPVAPPTGSGSTARTSPRHRSSASCCAGSRWCCPRCTACPTPSSATG